MNYSHCLSFRGFSNIQFGFSESGLSLVSLAIWRGGRRRHLTGLMPEAKFVRVGPGEDVRAELRSQNWQSAAGEDGALAGKSPKTLIHYRRLDKTVNICFV